MSENVRIALAILAAGYLVPFIPAWTFLALRSEVRTNSSAVVLLVHRSLPALILLVAVAIGSWDLALAAIALAIVTGLTVEFVKRRWPERWEAMGPVES